MKTFANISDLLKQTANYNLFVKLSNGYFIPVDKSAIKKTAESMSKNEDKFCGQIINVIEEIKAVQISIN